MEPAAREGLSDRKIRQHYFQAVFSLLMLAEIVITAVGVSASQDARSWWPANLALMAGINAAYAVIFARVAWGGRLSVRYVVLQHLVMALVKIGHAGLYYYGGPTVSALQTLVRSQWTFWGIYALFLAVGAAFAIGRRLEHRAQSSAP